jgi:signal transduction histidine kinase
MSARSIVARVTRTYVTGLALAAASIVLVSALVGSGVVVWRDDQDALALGRLLAQELDDHVDNPSSYDRVVRHELAEQHWFARRIEVWSGTDRLGGEEAEGSLAPFGSRATADCELTSVGGPVERVCVVQATMGASVVVASELAPMLEAMVPMLVAVALVALAVTLLAGSLGRRALATNLAPLARFEAEMAALPPRAAARSITRAWGSSELDSLAATFQAMLERIDEAVARETRFVSDAAHELRTPLTRLRTQLELAREELREGKAIDPRLAAAVRTAIELGDTTEALLAMARDTIGKTEPVELGDVVGALLTRLDEPTRARVRVAEGGAMADGVEPLITLAVSNLIDNAAKYAPGAIGVCFDEESEALVGVIVEDRGPGIDESELTRIAAPFVRGSSSQGIRGAGLGLALADHVARLHGGSLTIANRPGGGLAARLAVRRWRPSS